MSIQDDKENVNTFLKKIKKFSRPPERAGDRGASVLVAEVFPVADHDVGEELSVVGGVGNGVGSGSMVRRMSSSLGPPVAMMGTVGNSARILVTISGVLDAPETLRMSRPGGQPSGDRPYRRRRW